MKQRKICSLCVAVATSAALVFASCKDKPKDTDATMPAVDTTTIVTAPAQAPVVISPDDSLMNGVKDATKDFPGVTASVSNGEITLTGNITRDKLPKLMMSLSSLHPKKINNNLTIK